jgi:TRAP-type C4-dicarboxylate transport system permease small subunit
MNPNDSTLHATNRPDPLAPLAQASLWIAALAVLGLVGVQGWQVIARYLLNDSPGWTEPVAVLLLVSAMSFGSATAVHARTHFAFSLLAQRARPPLRRVLVGIQHTVVLSIGAVLAYWSGRLLLDGLALRMAGAPLPQSANFAPLLAGSALMVLFAAQALWRDALAPDPGKER